MMYQLEIFLLELRVEWLDQLFFAISFMTSGIFYMSLIAVGFWLRPGGVTFPQLGVLVPLTLILNLILKNSFIILRPDEAFHLIEVNSMLGFPCEDVMLATVFWVMLALRLQKAYFSAFAAIMIFLVMMSRIYLGVSYLSSIFGGFTFGLMTILWWRLELIQNIYYKWVEEGQYSSYWGLVIMIITAYFISADDDLYSQDFTVAAGSLIGFGASLKNLSNWQYERGMFSINHINSVVMSYAMLALLSEAIPTVHHNETLQITSAILEYAFLVFLVFSIFPQLQKTIIRDNL